MSLSKSNDLNENEISAALAKKIGIEYGDLIVAKTPTEHQEARIIEILELALTNEKVDFWISHLTCIKGMETGLLTEAAKKKYDDQKALLREHLGNPYLPMIRRPGDTTIQTSLQR